MIMFFFQGYLIFLKDRMFICMLVLFWVDIYIWIMPKLKMIYDIF